jgi:hypothetical protein
MAFVGALVATTLAVPALIEAQETRTRAERVMIASADGTDRMVLWVSPGGRAYLDVLDEDGVRRVSAAQGGRGAPSGPDLAGFFVYNAAGTQTAFVGTNRGPAGDLPFRSSVVLSDSQGQIRAALRVDDDGASLVFLDANGNVTWEAK